MEEADSPRGVGTPVVFEFDGRRIEAREGDSIASALLAIGQRVLREGPDGRPRGIFCGIGVCFDCLVDVDGVPAQRACMVVVRPNMRVTRNRP